ncbi:hypothetical protein J132_07405 [Termitomyces sp. J132]|nr:hypothetical protein J132_07405 [Termitomyces sp. J132]
MLSDGPSGAETSYSTPPCTPISPRSPLGPNRDQASSLRPSTLDSKPNHGLHELHRGSESTLRPEDQQWFAATMNSTSEGTIVASRAQANGRTARPYTPPPPSATSEMSESTFTKRYESDVDLDDYGTSIWKKRPTAESDELKSILRPPLKVQIEPVSPTSDSNPQQLSSFPPSLPPPHWSVTPSQLDLHPPAQLHPRRPPAGASKGPRGSTFTN